MFRRIADHKETDKNGRLQACHNSIILNNLKVLKRCKKSDLYSLESMLIEKQNPKLNTQIASNAKAKTLSRNGSQMHGVTFARVVTFARFVTFARVKFYLFNNYTVCPKMFILNLKNQSIKQKTKNNN